MLATPIALADVLNQAAIRAVYQPIVELDTGRTVGFEALARGPAGSAVEAPMDLLDAARSEGRLAEVDWLCRAAAIRGALGVGLRRPHALFVNVEPAAIATPAPDEIRPLIERAAGELRIVVEITERALHGDPAVILDAVAQIRQLGWEIALDEARVLGSTLGQGWHIARPSDRPFATNGMAVMSASQVAPPESRTHSRSSARTTNSESPRNDSSCR